MKQGVNHKSKSPSIWSATAFGIILSAVLSFVGAMICASLINQGMAGEQSYSVLSFVIWLIAAFCGTFVAATLAKQKYLIVCGMTVFGYLLFLTAIQIMFMDSQFQDVWKGIAVSVLGMIPTILLCGRSKVGRKTKVKYKPG